MEIDNKKHSGIIPLDEFNWNWKAGNAFVNNTDRRLSQTDLKSSTLDNAKFHSMRNGETKSEFLGALLTAGGKLFGQQVEKDTKTKGLAAQGVCVKPRFKPNPLNKGKWAAYNDCVAMRQLPSTQPPPPDQPPFYSTMAGKVMIGTGVVVLLLGGILLTKKIMKK